MKNASVHISKEIEKEYDNKVRSRIKNKELYR